MASTELRALKVIQLAGGKVTETEVSIPVQKPKPPKLEQWSPGIPDRRIPATDAAWEWRGAWKEKGGRRGYPEVRRCLSGTARRA